MRSLPRPFTHSYSHSPDWPLLLWTTTNMKTRQKKRRKRAGHISAYFKKLYLHTLAWSIENPGIDSPASASPARALTSSFQSTSCNNKLDWTVLVFALVSFYFKVIEADYPDCRTCNHFITSMDSQLWFERQDTPLLALSTAHLKYEWSKEALEQMRPRPANDCFAYTPVYVRGF